MRIRVCDLETTGEKPPEAMPCEIGWCDVVQVGEAWVLDPNSNQGEVFVQPGHPIPPKVSAIHHIVDADVAVAAPWAQIAPSVLDNHFQEVGTPPAVALAAHFAKFERQWCTDEITGGLSWICTWKCALRLWPEAPSHSNGALRYWRGHKLNREIADKSHRAFPDAYVTAHHLLDMLNGGATVDQLIAISAAPALLPRVNFGKHRGAAWSAVPSDYIDWVLRQNDMDENVIFTAKHELARRRTAEP